MIYWIDHRDYTGYSVAGNISQACLIAYMYQNMTNWKTQQRENQYMHVRPQCGLKCLLIPNPISLNLIGWSIWT